jgi:hypothetical protein
MSVPGTQTKFNDNTFYFQPAGGGGAGGSVTSIVAGTGITITPPAGTGAVTINGKASDAPINSIQLSDGAGGFVSNNATLINPTTGALSLGNGTITSNGQINSTYTAVTAPIQPGGSGLYGSFSFNFGISADGGADVVITPLQTLLTNGRCIAISMLDSAGPTRATCVVAGGGTGGLAQGISGQSSRYKLYVPVSGGNAFQVVCSPISGGGGAGGTAVFTVTLLA